MESTIQTQCTLNSTTFNADWDDMVAGSTTLVLAFFFYGFYLNLFIVAIYILSRRKTAGKRVLLAFTCAMAVLGTTQMVLRLAMSVMSSRIFLRSIQHGASFNNAVLPPSKFGGTYNSMDNAYHAIFIINNLVADSLFLYRCFMVWGSQWKIIILPAFFMVATFVTGCVAFASPSVSTRQTVQQSPYIMATITNLVLVLLTVGRIWWIRRDALHIGTSDLKTRYNSVIAMIVESGAIYCIFTVLLIITYPLGVSFMMLQTIATHLINIVPTLIIVRVGLGQHTQPILEHCEGRGTTFLTPLPVRDSKPSS
ncbi:hypothetical protein MVEN_00928900 [Mycena venus]|uniref:Uncharacterized protein n=1 Tax=Mycena venus TaxID=2733690 RepID=A0A8H6Y811_9AGAR|nr:hypothetical protein MVEN_00928900 [Mycena venus]